MQHELKVWVHACYVKVLESGEVVERVQNIVGETPAECATVALISAEHGEHLSELIFQGTFQDYLDVEAESSKSTLAIGWVDIEEEDGFELTK